MTGLRYVLKHKDGRVFDGQLGVDIRKTLDKRGGRDMSQVVYEIRDPKSGIWTTWWTDELEGVDAEMVQ